MSKHAVRSSLVLALASIAAAGCSSAAPTVLTDVLGVSVTVTATGLEPAAGVAAPLYCNATTRTAAATTWGVGGSHIASLCPVAPETGDPDPLQCRTIVCATDAECPPDTATESFACEEGRCVRPDAAYRDVDIIAVCLGTEGRVVEGDCADIGAHDAALFARLDRPFAAHCTPDGACMGPIDCSREP